MRAPAASASTTDWTRCRGGTPSHAGRLIAALTAATATVRPSTAPMVPATRARAATRRAIWTAVAPRSRSSASSRRWASASADAAARPRAAATTTPGIPSRRNRILALVASVWASVRGSAALSATRSWRWEWRSRRRRPGRRDSGCDRWRCGSPGSPVAGWWTRGRTAADRRAPTRTAGPAAPSARTSGSPEPRSAARRRRRPGPRRRGSRTRCGRRGRRSSRPPGPSATAAARRRRGGW